VNFCARYMFSLTCHSTDWRDCLQA